MAPAGDLIYSNAYDILMTDVTQGFVVGQAVVEGGALLATTRSNGGTARPRPMSVRGARRDNQQFEEYRVSQQLNRAVLVTLGLAAALGLFAPAAAGRDPGINQPGRVGNVGVGAPGIGVVDPGLNQPRVAGNVGGVVRRSVRY